MKVNKKFVEEVANGKYSDYDRHGEMQESALRILEERIVSKFSTFCFRVFGGELPDNVMDIYDAFVDFALHGTEISVWNKNETDVVYKFDGMTEREALMEMNEWVWKNHDKKGYKWLEECEFKVKGVSGKFHLSLANFHYCFAKGRINEKQLLDFCKVA